MFSDGITSKKNYQNFIIQVNLLIIENGTQNLKFTIIRTDDINSVKMYKRILRKVE